MQRDDEEYVPRRCLYGADQSDSGLGHLVPEVTQPFSSTIASQFTQIGVELRWFLHTGTDEHQFRIYIGGLVSLRILYYESYLFCDASGP